MVLQKNFRNRSNLPRLTFLYELTSKGQSIFPLLLTSPRLHKRSLTAGPTRKHVRRTSFSSAGGLTETTARADRIVTHSLPDGFIFAILLGVGRNWGAMGNTGDTGKAQCPEHLFTRSSGPRSSACMSCIHRIGLSSVFSQQTKPRGSHGSVRALLLPSTARRARSMSTWSAGHVGEPTGMPTRLKRAAPASAILDERRPSRWLIWRRRRSRSGASSSPRKR